MGMCQQDSAVERAVEVNPFERANTRHSDSIEFCQFASTSPTLGHRPARAFYPGTSGREPRQNWSAPRVQPLSANFR
jgi:hypothetical protein